MWTPYNLLNVELVNAKIKNKVDTRMSFSIGMTNKFINENQLLNTLPVSLERCNTNF